MIVVFSWGNPHPLFVRYDASSRQSCAVAGHADAVGARPAACSQVANRVVAMLQQKLNGCARARGVIDRNEMQMFWPGFSLVVDQYGWYLDVRQSFFVLLGEPGRGND